MKSIALFDHKVVQNDPIGGCHLRMLEALSSQYQFTVFATEFENPRPEQIVWVRIPGLRRPLVLQFLCYHLLAPLYYKLYCLKNCTAFDAVQTTENCTLFSDIAYVQFCHRTYLKRHWKYARARGVRGCIRWLDHQLRALLEPTAYRRATKIVVPSRSFAAELTAEYPWIQDKLVVISNPVDIVQLKKPADFDRNAFRNGIDLSAHDIVLVFVALGQYERKGLPLLLEALTRISEPRLKLLVVGGEPDLVSLYQKRAQQMALSTRVVFTGIQRNVSPFLWAADAFAFPSSYETFSLVSFEAGAAGLPLLISPLHGIGEVLRDGENGFLLEATPEGVEKGLRRFLALSQAERRVIGERARLDVGAYSIPSFVSAWRAFYQDVLEHSLRERYVPAKHAIAR